MSAPETKVFEDEFKGNPMLAIHKVDEDGVKHFVKADIKFGLTKAKMILNHLPEIKEFVEKNDK